MRIFSATTLVLLFAVLGNNASAQERRVNDLTANDLAEVLGVHWWIVKIPPLRAHDMVGVEVVKADGKVLVGPGGFSGPDLGDEITIFCREEPARQESSVTIRTKGGTATTHLNDYFKDAAVGGTANGVVLKVDDILIKFDKSSGASFTGGNEMLPGQIGLKVVITHRP